MRVHHIVNNYSLFAGGAERIARYLHEGLQARGVESFLLGLTYQQDAHLEHATSLGLKSPYAMKALVGVYHYIKYHVKPGDVVHVQLFPSMFFAAVARTLLRPSISMVYTEHSTWNRRRGTRWGRWLDSFMYSQYEQIIAISKGVEEQLLSWQPHLKGRTRVIYNGIPLTFHQVIRRPRSSRTVVLSVGNLRPAKNYDTAVKAIALLKDLVFEYWIAGTGPSEPELLRLSKDLGIEHRVRFLGYVPFQEIPALLQNAHIFLVPSRWEGFGLATVEAMNASLPVVASNVPGLREIVDSNPPCAILVDPNSPESIADGLRQLLMSHALREELGTRAFERSQEFSVDRMLENYLGLYDSILHKFPMGQVKISQ